MTFTNLHEVIAAWKQARAGEEKREVIKAFKVFVANEATTGDVYELLRAISARGFVSTNG